MNPIEETPLRVETRDGVAVLTMNRPERLNALSQPMIDAGIAALERCEENVHAASTKSYASLLDREAFSQGRTGGTADHREGVAAFMEKRALRFAGS